MRTTLLACSFMAALALSIPSAAQPGPRADADTRTQWARKLHVEGDTLYERGEYDRAYIAYLGAWNFKKHYQIAGNLGDCEIRLGKYQDAAEHLAYFLREYPADKPADRLQKGKQLFEEARSKIGTIYVTVNAPKAKILVDGKVIGESPLEEPLYLAPGIRLIEAHRGRDRVAEHLTITPGFTRRVDLKLPKVPVVAPPAGPRAKRLLATGDSTNDGTGSKVVSVPATTGDSKKARTPSNVVPILAGTGVAVAGILAGAAFSLGAWDSNNRRQALVNEFSHPPAGACLSRTLSENDKQKCNQIGTFDMQHDIFFVFAVSFAAAGFPIGGLTTLSLWPQQSTAVHRVEATTVVSPKRLTIGLKGTF